MWVQSVSYAGASNVFVCSKPEILLVTIPKAPVGCQPKNHQTRTSHLMSDGVMKLSMFVKGVNNTLHILGMGEVVFGVPNGKIFAKRKTPLIYIDKVGGFDGV